ncbi:MAG: HAD family hydrolase [Pseudomonadota bacterium]
MTDLTLPPEAPALPIPRLDFETGESNAAAVDSDLLTARLEATKTSDQLSRGDLTHQGEVAPHQILPHELPQALARAPDGITTLSLDCFDTLLWRDCHAPTDVFADLPGLLIGQRAGGEANARKVMRTLKGSNEVSLDDIYAQVMPNASAAQRKAAIAAELEAEAHACFAFAPTVELILDAKARGLEIIIVSDTYLSAAQLRELIAAAAGEEIAALIDRIFASSQEGASKSEGLLVKALKGVKRRPHEVLHIGDNLEADYKSARTLGVPALHLLQFDEAAQRRLRFERVSQQLIAGQLGSREACPVGLQPHRALLAAGEPQIETPARALGFSVLGPVFTAYDGWLREEAERLEKARGGTVHWLFMLRDGHLPDVVHAAGGRAESTARVEISRYVATAASLTTREAYERHAALEHGLNPATLARQMLLTDEEIERVVGDPRTDLERAEASTRLLKELRQGQRQKLTIRRARAMSQALVQHVRAAVDPQPGDTLMLVDLGYNGSAQNAVDALLSRELGVHVAGRYLLCREWAATGFDKRGLIDAEHYDPGLLEAMCANVAVIEQLATCELGSVLGYDEAGAPIRTHSSVKGAQSAVRDEVQAGAVRFATAARTNPAVRVKDTRAPEAWRGCAAQVLTRFMFLPDAQELKVIKSFEHDVNLGSERMVALFDEDDASEQMKRRGLFYMKGSSRMFLPADLASEDMSTRLALMVQKRFGLGLTYADYSPRCLELPAFFIAGSQSATAMFEARPTHDGYYVARIPVAASGRAMALQLGGAFEWVEIAGITRSLVATLSGDYEDEAAKPCATVRFDDMHEHAPGLFQCLSDTALVMILPDETRDDEAPGAQMVEVVLRPLIHRNTPSDEAQRESHA